MQSNEVRDEGAMRNCKQIRHRRDDAMPTRRVIGNTFVSFFFSSVSSSNTRLEMREQRTAKNNKQTEKSLIFVSISSVSSLPTLNVNLNSMQCQQTQNENLIIAHEHFRHIRTGRGASLQTKKITTAANICSFCSYSDNITRRMCSTKL